MLAAIFSPLKISGREKIPPGGGFIVASNHISNLDPFLIGLCFHRRIAYMAKDSLFRTKIGGFFFRQVEAFPVRRGEQDVWAVREAMKRLKRGLPVLMFPEGTRQGKGPRQKVHSGIGFLAVKAGVPILPVHIRGADKVLPPGKKWPANSYFPLYFMGMPHLSHSWTISVVCSSQNFVLVLSLSL